jgi:hypothetical protein
MNSTKRFLHIITKCFNPIYSPKNSSLISITLSPRASSTAPP